MITGDRQVGVTLLRKGTADKAKDWKNTADGVSDTVSSVMTREDLVNFRHNPYNQTGIRVCEWMKAFCKR